MRLVGSSSEEGACLWQKLPSLPTQFLQGSPFLVRAKGRTDPQHSEDRSSLRKENVPQPQAQVPISLSKTCLCKS